MKTHKYYVVHFGTIHGFDEYESEGYSAGIWATYKTDDGCRFGIEQWLISDTEIGAVLLYIKKQQKMVLDHIESANSWAQNVALLVEKLSSKSSTDAASETILKKVQENACAVSKAC